MFKKLSNAMLGMSLAFVSILPMQFVNSLVKAEETEKFIIVDDTEIDENQEHYFTYHGGMDPNQSGSQGGWVSDTKNDITGEEHAKTQHWVWKNGDNGVAARAHTYDFTFTGTGVEIYGVPNDSVNVFTLDNGTPEAINEASKKNGNNPVVLYSKMNLQNTKHTVKVSLPSDGNVTGLQVCYAKVFGAKENPDKPKNVKTSIDPTVQEGVNSFKFISSESNKWSIGSNEAYIDFKQGNAEAENSYYEVKFIGNKIEIEAAKAPNHGYVKFSVERDSASSSSTIICKIPKGHKVEIVEEKDGWIRIGYGWVSSKYIKSL